MSYAVLEVVGRDDTIDLLDGVNYALVSWAPAVSARERALLGNYSPYTDVEESIAIDIFGSSVTEVLDALDRVNICLEQADAWSLGENVPPVLIRVQLNGSDLTEPLEAVIVGRPPGGNTSVMLQPTFNQDLLLYEIRQVELRFVRRGLWLGATVTKSTGTTYTNPATMSLDMDSKLARLSPTALRVTHFDANTPMLGDGFLLITGIPVNSTYGSNVAVYPANVMDSDEFDPDTDTANNAFDDNILTIDASANQTGSIAIPNVYADASRISLFAAIRNNHATTTWRVRAFSVGYATATDSWKTIDASSQQPRVVYAGTVTNQSGLHVSLQLDFAASANVGTLDVNYVVMFGHDPSSHYITIRGDAYSDEPFPRALSVADRATTHQTPLVYIETTAEGE